MKHIALFILGCGLAFVCIGCASYIAPGGKAELQAFAPPNIQAGFDAKPTSPFPASVVAVRVQAPDYSNYSLRRNGGKYGTGRYSVITAREAEEQAQLERVRALPQIVGIIGLNRLLLPAQLTGDRELREAASRLQGDLVFLYTFDTAFYDSDASRPLTVITLGLSPTRKISAITTVSGLLMDTRTGFIYSAYEASQREATLSTSWGSQDAADETRRKTERQAFVKLIDEVVSSWPLVLDRYGKKN